MNQVNESRPETILRVDAPPNLALHSKICTQFFESIRTWRTMWPEKLKDFANIKDEVAFIGQGYFFQITNPKVAIDLQNKSRTRLNLNKKTLGKILRGSNG